MKFRFLLCALALFAAVLPFQPGGAGAQSFVAFRAFDREVPDAEYLRAAPESGYRYESIINVDEPIFESWPALRLLLLLDFRWIGPAEDQGHYRILDFDSGAGLGLRWARWDLRLVGSSKHCVNETPENTCPLQVRNYAEARYWFGGR